MSKEKSDEEKTPQMEENKSKREKSSKKFQGSPLTPEEKELLVKNITVKIILWITMIGLFAAIIGIIWGIGDLFSTDKWPAFLNLAIQTKLFIIGLILLGIFFLVLFLVVFYQRGKKGLSASLFKEAPEGKIKETKEYLPAKIITAGGLLSFFLIFVGLIIAFMQFLFGKVDELDDPLGIWNFISSLPDISMGSVILVSAALILILDGLIYGMIYIWQNGYYLVINKILRYNQKISDIHDFSKNEKTVGLIIFGLVVAILVGIVFGIVWAIINTFISDWGTAFRGYPFGIKLSFYGIFGSLLFATLVAAMFFYKWGNNIIMISLFIQYHPINLDKDRVSAKVVAIGILAAIVLIAVSLIIWIIVLIVNAFASDGTGQNLFTLLAGLSGGLALLAYSLITEIFVILALLFSFFLHNGYAFTLKKIIKAEELIDEGLETGKRKALDKKEDRKQKKKEKKPEKKDKKDK